VGYEDRERRRLQARRWRICAAAITAALLVALPAAGASADSEAEYAARARAYELCPNINDRLGSLSRGRLRRSIACLLNQERRFTGLHRVRPDSRLIAPGRHHNWDMQQNLHALAHPSSNGDSFSTRISRFGYMNGARQWAVGEILADGYGTYTPRSVMYGWMASAPHSRVLHDPRYRQIGIAVIHGTAANPAADGALFTVDFGMRRR
jgi:uncharacterized protein YkwD